MTIAHLFIGIAVGSILAGAGVLAGGSLWSVFLIYSFGGSLAMLASALLVHILPRENGAFGNVIGSPKSDGVLV